MTQLTLAFGGIHFARLEYSPRLQRVLKYLTDKKPHSTRDIVREANVCAVNSCIDELRQNGFNIKCARKGNVWRYQLL